MANACQDITVYAESFDHQGGPAFYAALPDDGETRNNGCRTKRAADQKHLLSLLLDHVLEMNNPHWQYRYLLDRAAFPIQMVHGPLGRPHLFLG